MQEQTIEIKLQAFDYKLLDAASREIVNTVKRIGSALSGPIPLPTRIEKYTVKRSPHIFKEAQEQFEIRKHRRLIMIRHSNVNTVTALMKVDLAYGVDVEIRVKN
jgi:small subunit ribosomal protein S10